MMAPGSLVRLASPSRLAARVPNRSIMSSSSTNWRSPQQKVPGKDLPKVDWSQWHTRLTQYARHPNPRKAPELEGVYLRHDPYTLAIYDKFPKARFHFLVLPRMPFVLDTDKADDQGSAASNQTTAPKLSLAGGKLSMGTSKSGGTVPPAHLHSLSDLLASPYAAQVLAKMRVQGEAVADLVRQEMRHARVPSTSKQACGVEWGVRLGFHAVPSMDTVHLHVISDDLVSDSLKHKKHYNSFKHDHGFWLSIDHVEYTVRQGKRALPRKERDYDALLRSPLVSFRNGKEYSNMPKLKEHLKEAWEADVAARQQRQEGSSTLESSMKRNADELSPASSPASKEAKRSPS